MDSKGSEYGKCVKALRALPYFGGLKYVSTDAAQGECHLSSF